MRIRKIVALVVLIWAFTFSNKAQDIFNLYPDKIPNSKDSNIAEVSKSGMFSRVSLPTLEVYLPEKEKNTGAAVVICPGGGYSVLVYQGEGIATAKEFAKYGITAFVLKYRLPDDSLQFDKEIAPLQDAQQAIKIVRENAAKWGVDSNKIGIMGFSAGGHLASTEATHYNESHIENSNNTSLRPDFQILVYPVISMQDNLTHRDSRTKLLGENPSKETIDHFSNELQVNENTPPAYITHAADDKLVDVDNSINYFEKLNHLNVPAELHIYQKGDHGFIFGRPGWMESIIRWMKDSKWSN
jgi:acetyl esterase/lipase